MFDSSNDRVELRVDPIDSGAVVYDAGLCSASQAQAWLAGEGEGVAGGRGGVRYVTTEAGRAVVRHYRRGGLVAGLLGDRFLYTGLERTRPLGEIRVLARARALGLPVPRPIAARFLKDGPFYRADIATLAIEPVRTLATLVAHHDVAGFDWRRLGRTIRRFHDAGVWHADLNAHNVLHDDAGELWLLDFDRGWLAPPRDAWRRANLARLERSLRKVGLARAVDDVERDAFEPMRAGYAEASA